MSEEQKNLDVEAGGADLEAEEWSMQSHDPRNQNDIDRERSQEEPLVRTVVIDWEPCDPSNPMHWSSTRKTIAVIAICALAFSVSFSSTVFAPASKQITEEFGVSDIVAKLGVSLYVLGLAIGKFSKA